MHKHGSLRGHPKWVNQFAYDVTWKGRRKRVFIKRLKPIFISDALIRQSSVSVKELCAVLTALEAKVP